MLQQIRKRLRSRSKRGSRVPALAQPGDDGIGNASHVMSRVVDRQWRRREDPPKALQRTGDPRPEVFVLILSERREQLPHTRRELLDDRVLNEDPLALPCSLEVVQLRDF